MIAPAARVRFRIQPASGWMGLRLDDLWRYRELTYFLVWRDVKVRYKQTVLGIAWAVLQPVLTMAIFSLFFGRLAKIPSDGIPYPLFSLAGLVPWTFFASALMQSSMSLIGSSSLLTKIYFPRLLIPFSTVCSTLVDLGFALLALVGLMAYYGILPGATVFTLPLFVLLAFITALGVGLWASALSIRFRDVRYVIPFLTQFWMIATPIAYPASLLDERWRALYALNPMVGVVEGFRWALLGSAISVGPMMLVSSAVSLALLISGLFYFRRLERTFADLV